MEKDNKKKEKARKIEHLGLHEDGFWVWYNAVLGSNRQLLVPDDYCNVSVNGKTYHLPWLEDIPTQMRVMDFSVGIGMGDLKTWSGMMRMAYGDRGIVAVNYALAAIFKDLCDDVVKSFPMLYICGRQGTGKTRLACSLMALMGNPVKGPDLGNLTKGQLKRWLGLLRNGYVHIDEFRNNERASLINMLSRFPKEGDCGLILSGQERHPWTRQMSYNSIILHSDKYLFNKTEELALQALRSYESLGLSCITNKLQEYRSEKFAAMIRECYEYVCGVGLQQDIDTKEIKEDMLRSWCIVPAVSLALNRMGVQLEWNFDYFMRVYETLLVEQWRKFRV